jgi:WD40 repeat protein
MKETSFSIFSLLLIVSMICLPDISAQEYTRWELPEYAIARLGKGRIEDMRYSPDGTILAVATTIGIWIYDTETYQERSLLAQNNKGVRKISFDAKGTTITSRNWFGGITLWDVTTRKPKKTLTNRFSIFSPDGETFAIRDFTNKIHLRDTATGESKHILEGHTDFVSCVSFSPDGQTLASGSKDQTIHLWDVATGEQKGTLAGHPSPVTSIIFSPEGQTLASRSKDQTVHLWDVATGKLKGTLTGHPSPVTSIIFSPEGSTLTSMSDDKTIYLWDTATGERKKTLADQGVITEPLERQEMIERAFFSSDGDILVTVRFNNTIRLWDTTTGALIQTLTNQEIDVKQTDYQKKIGKVLFSPDKRIFVSIGGDKIHLWDVVTGAYKSLTEPPSYDVKSAALSPDGRTLATGTFDGIIRLWDVATGKHKKTINNLNVRLDRTHRTDNIPLSPNGEKFATGNHDGTVYLWDGITRQAQPLSGQVYHLKDQPFRKVLFSPDGSTLASWGMSKDVPIRLWDVTTGKRQRTLTGHAALIKRVTFSPDGNTLASWSSHDETTIRLWDVGTGKHKRTLTGHIRLVESVAFSPDGKTLVSGGLDSTVHLWDAVTGKNIRTFTDEHLTNQQMAQSSDVMTVSFSSEGNRLAGGRRDGLIQLWDVATGQLLQTFRGHVDAISSVTFSPDGFTIASTGKDATARLWDVATGQQKRLLAGYKGAIWRVKFYPNGLPLASDIKSFNGGPNDENIRLWDLRTGQLKKRLTGHASWVTGLSFSADGKTLASVSFDDTVLLWDLTSTIKALDVAE